MLTKQAHPWVENYLYRAHGHRALEQSVLAEGERHGFSERSLRKACRTLGVDVNAGCWELHPGRVAAIVQHELAELTSVPQLTLAPALARRAA